MTAADTDHRHLRAAFAAARAARARGDMPFGAVLARDGVALHTAMNGQLTTADCMGHAEVVLVREVAATLGTAALRGATVYASGEPCAMCAGALFWAGVARVVYGATTPDIEAALGGPALGARCADVLAGASPGVDIAGPLLRDEAVATLAST